VGFADSAYLAVISESTWEIMISVIASSCPLVTTAANGKKLEKNVRAWRDQGKLKRLNPESRQHQYRATAEMQSPFELEVGIVVVF
jgi:hypothetical protein